MKLRSILSAGRSDLPASCLTAMCTQTLIIIVIIRFGVILLADTPNWYMTLPGPLSVSAILIYLNILNKINCNMKTVNKKLRKNRRRNSRAAVGRFELRSCGVCYGCRTGKLPCARPYFVWFPF